VSAALESRNLGAGLDPQALVARLDPRALTVATLGSHSALEICRGAKREGLPTLVVAQRGRDRTYSQHFKTRGDEGCVDEVILVERFRDVLSEAVQAELGARHAIWVPHRSFEVYLDSDYDAIEGRFEVPMFGNRRLLRIEERELHPNQYDLLAEAGIPHPRLFSTPDEIDRPVIVKVLEAERGFERAFFVARDTEEYRRIASERIASGAFTERALLAATIEEFVLGAQVNLNFFYSAMDERLELMGTDARRQTNVAGLAGLPGAQHDEVVRAVGLKYEEAGHMAVTILESMLERAFELGERFVEAAARRYPPGVIGPFALQSIVVPGPPKKDFIVVDVSPRVPGSPGITATPYSAYLHGRPVAVGERIAIELRKARDAGRLMEVLT
jgi:5-formaminoimidazole-4-carboxamide-1-(beta)-D-ribofuranosyl 5'-monophosphate synthetase